MKNLSLAFIATILLAASACNKGVILPEPIITLDYVADSSSYSRTEFISKDGDLITAAFASWQPNYASNDSVIMLYTSNITTKANSISMYITIAKAYSKNDLDTATINGNLRYWPKTDALFYDAFKTGKAKIRSVSGTQYEVEGIDIDLTIYPKGYTTRPNPNSVNDTAFNEVEIKNTETNIDWFPVYNNIYGDGAVSVRKMMVEFNFNCALYVSTNQNDKQLINGRFKSFFMDRNPQQ